MTEQENNKTQRGLGKADPKKREEAAARLDRALEKLRQDRKQSLVPEESDVFGYIPSKVEEEIVEPKQPETSFQLTLDDLTQGTIEEETFDSMEISQQSEAEQESVQEEILWKTESTRKRRRRKKRELKRKQKEQKKAARQVKQTQAEEETPLKEEQPVPQEVKQPSAPKKKRNIPWKWILPVFAVLALLFGGYWYKISVYDPNHVISEEQQKTYDKLVEYADEWDMLSDSEKEELNEYRDAYKDLVPKQKENINAYFKEHTGKTLTQIFTDLKNKEKNQAGKEEDNVKEIVEYLSGWPDYDRSVKLKIVDYKETYLNMSVEHQQQVNNAAKKYSSYDFMSLVNYYEPVSESSNSTTTTPAEQSGTVSSASQYQAQINELQQTLVEYENYGVQLQQQLAATTDSQMAATIQAEIAANNQMIQQYQIQIYQLQNEMEASGQ